MYTRETSWKRSYPIDLRSTWSRNSNFAWNLGIFPLFSFLCCFKKVGSFLYNVWSLWWCLRPCLLFKTSLSKTRVLLPDKAFFCTRYWLPRSQMMSSSTYNLQCCPTALTFAFNQCLNGYMLCIPDYLRVFYTLKCEWIPTNSIRLGCTSKIKIEVGVLWLFQKSAILWLPMML